MCKSNRVQSDAVMWESAVPVQQSPRRMHTSILIGPAPKVEYRRIEGYRRFEHEVFRDATWPGQGIEVDVYHLCPKSELASGNGKRVQEKRLLHELVHSRMREERE